MQDAAPGEGQEPVPVSVASVVLSPGFQRAAGPAAALLLAGGYGGFRLAWAVGLPRPELIALLAIGIAVCLASVAVTLGVVLLVSRTTPYRRGAFVSILLGIVGFIAAGPIFLLVAGAPAAG